MNRPPAAVLWIAAAFVLAGCFGGGPGERPPPTDDALQRPAAPASCDANRTAVAHLPGGMPATDATGPLPIPCLSKTGYNSREPTIGISAKGTVFHYPAMTGDNTRPSGVALTRDDGATWSLSLPDVAGQPTHVVSTDPYFFLDATTGRIFADDLNVPNCSMFSWSDDEGEAWDHSYSGCLETDHQSIFTGQPVTSTTVGYPNVVYRCAINAVALAGTSTMTTCQRSLDGGRTWLPPGQPAYVTDPDAAPDVCSGAAGHGKTDARGSVYLPKGHCGVPMLSISDDEGLGWHQSVVSDLGFTENGHDSAVAVDPAGTIYYFWIARDRLPYLTYSPDHAATWSEPLMVGAPGVNEVSQPEMIVGGVGKVAFVYMGTTNGPGAPFTGSYAETTWNAYVGMSVDALAGSPTFYTASINDPETDPFVVGTCDATRCQGVQDFLDIRIAPNGTPWAALIDDCVGEGVDCGGDPNAVLDTSRVGAVGRLWGGLSLWDADDPNGAYP